MKKLLFLLLLFIGFQHVQSQEILNDTIILQQSDIVGRWEEANRLISEADFSINDTPDIYVFKEDGVFHRGKSSEGMVLFNIAGRYRVEGDSIKMVYQDFTSNRAGGNKVRKMTIRIMAYSEDEMSADIKESYYKHFVSILKRLKAK